ncbi:Hypothetical protein PBC10988_2130 [Planctomycetales bacterium 10988]|nr:Hypothetical protein PBC10988_2130 [Planctomycetales bacterium 10988]
MSRFSCGFLVFLFGTMFLLAGCESTTKSKGPRIDGSSSESMQASLERINETLSLEKQQELQESIDFLIDSDSVLKLSMGDSGYSKPVLNYFDGKTAKEIITKANKMKHAQQFSLKHQISDDLEAMRENQQKQFEEIQKDLP